MEAHSEGLGLRASTYGFGEDAVQPRTPGKGGWKNQGPRAAWAETSLTGRTFVFQEVVGNEVQREAGLDPAGPGKPWQEFQMYCKGTEKPSAAC